jgi:ribonuclease Z
MIMLLKQGRLATDLDNGIILLRLGEGGRALTLTLYPEGKAGFQSNNPMFELTFLGTSASAPSVRRNLSATLVFHEDLRFMIDCGEGTQRQLLRSGVGFKRLNTVLLTHGHLDHILGLGGIVSTFARWEAIDRFSIYGGRWALDRVRDLMNVVLRGGEVSCEVTYEEIRPGLLIDSRRLQVRAFPVNHKGGGSFGFVFQEKAHRPFLVDRAVELGVPEGPERRLLVAGQPVVLPNGTVVRPDDVLGPPIHGAKLVYVGDVTRTDGIVDAATGADALVIEATYSDADGDIAHRFGHITAREAALVAGEAGVRQLFLNHISRRYSGHEIEEEARAVFPNAVVVEDLDHYLVRKVDLAGES